MIYEGTTHHPDSLGSCWGDTIGLSRSKQLEGPFTERHPLQVRTNDHGSYARNRGVYSKNDVFVLKWWIQVIIPPQPDPSFDSTWTGWPRAYLEAATGELQVLYSAGGRDMQNSSLHDYASTGLRKWSLEKLANWSAL